MCRDHFIHEALINLIPHEYGSELNILRGIPNDKLAEIVVAIGCNKVAIDGNGMDYSDGSECKFANLVTDVDKDGYRRVHTKVSNLKNKTGDLYIVLSDAISEVGKVDLRFFKFPYRLWKKMIKGDDFKMSFTSDRWSWYKDHEYTWEELCDEQRGLERF